MFGIGWITKKGVSGFCEFCGADEETAEDIGNIAKWGVRALTVVGLAEVGVEAIVEAATSTGVESVVKSSASQAVEQVLDSSTDASETSVCGCAENHDPSFTGTQGHSLSMVYTCYWGCVHHSDGTVIHNLARCKGDCCP